MKNIVSDLYKEAMTAFVGKKYDDAIDMLSRALALDPDFTLGYTSRGAAFLQRDLPDNALADFDRAIEANDNYAKAFHLRGLTKERLDDNKGAMKDFDRAIELDAEYGAAYYSRANLYTKLGDNENAANDIERVTHLTNRNIETFANDNNLWRSHHLNVEDAIESEMHR